MRGLLRFMWRFPMILLWIISGLMFVTICYAWLPKSVKKKVTSGWSWVLLRLFGLSLRFANDNRLESGVLLVANHISWADIFAINQVLAVCFVAKKEIRAWPVIGWLVRGVGTIFIDRSDKRDLQRVSLLIKNRLASSVSVGLFPEGTTSDGTSVLPFKGGLLEVAIQLKLPVQPLLIRYYVKGKRSIYPSYVGEETLFMNVWRLLRQPGITIELEVLDVLLPTRLGMNRRQLAQHLEQAFIHKLAETPVLDGC